MFPQPNWVRVIHEKTSKTQDLALLSNAFAELDIWGGIKYKFQAGFDLGAKNTEISLLQQRVVPCLLLLHRRQADNIIPISIIAGQLKTC